MTPKSAINWLAPSDEHDLEGELILNGLSSAILAINAEQSILKLNAAAEHFLSSSANNIIGHLLSDFIPPDSPLFVLIEQVRVENQAISESDLTIETPRIGRHFVNVQAAPIAERPGVIILSIHSRSIAEKIDRQLSHRGAARSVTAMASMMAHEVKNPLSGIRGAAQLLEDTVSKDDQSLTQLIRDEVDRIVALVDRMGMFANDAPTLHQSVNIHQVLDRVLQVSKNGFGRHSRFVTQFDPSLPPVRGDRDQLVQVFLNLTKNAVEANLDEGAEIVMKTSYQHGVRFTAPGNGERVHLPLAISISDNGTGISDEMMPHLFDPFVTSKPKGSGLGLALVAKIIGDHGGIVECETANTRTVFRVMLPMFQDREGIK